MRLLWALGRCMPGVEAIQQVGDVSIGLCNITAACVCACTACRPVARLQGPLLLLLLLLLLLSGTVFSGRHLQSRLCTSSRPEPGVTWTLPHRLLYAGLLGPLCRAILLARLLGSCTSC